MVEIGKHNPTESDDKSVSHLVATGHKYDTGYEKPDLRGTEDQRPWDLQDIIKQCLSPQASYVDVGCGTATKLIPLAGFAKRVIGVDNNLTMLKRAYENTQNAGAKITFIHGDSDHLPFASDSIDTLTYMLSPRNSLEAVRVLKPEQESVLIAENVGRFDKKNIEAAFGNDSSGKPRGCHIGNPKRSIAYTKLDIESAGFRIVDIREGYWNTWYIRSQLEELCKSTPVARNFDPERDRHILDRIEQEYLTPRGIETQQHRILVIARKK